MMRNIKTRDGFEFWDKLNALPRYAFLLSPSGKSVQKFEDQAMGNWIDVHEAQKVVDQAQDEINQFRAERDALQQRLNATDQKVDELVSAVRSMNRGRHHEVFMPGDDEPQYAQRKEWVDWILALCGEVSAAPKPLTEQFIEDHLGKRPDQLRDHTKMIDAPRPERIKGMIETVGGEYAVMIDPENGHYGWTFKKHPDGQWVSGRKATEREMIAARSHAQITNQL
ncbi:hypothetical protein [Pseudomonas glycinae]|uniref:hypothetical protein n=1 Tax=Pseudomonas glycinae TaxID=1785145 RepID=UPI002B1CEC64|nr:hypothetical protein [Pseudomonas glycinae]